MQPLIESIEVKCKNNCYSSWFIIFSSNYFCNNNHLFELLGTVHWRLCNLSRVYKWLEKGNQSERQEPTSKRSKTIPKINITIDSRGRMGKALLWGDVISLEKRTSSWINKHLWIFFFEYFFIYQEHVFESLWLLLAWPIL